MGTRPRFIMQVALACAIAVAGATILLVRSGDPDDRTTALPSIPEIDAPAPGDNGAPQAGDEIPPFLASGHL